MITGYDKINRLPSFFKYFSDIRIQAKRTIRNFFRTVSLAKIQAGIKRFFILRGHPPKWVLNNGRRIPTDAKL